MTLQALTLPPPRINNAIWNEPHDIAVIYTLFLRKDSTYSLGGEVDLESKKDTKKTQNFITKECMK